MNYRDLPGGTLRFIAGQTVSFLGDTSMWMACSIWVKTLTQSNGAAALTFFFYLTPTIFNSPAGLLVDRVRHRPFLIAANLAGAIFLLPLFAVRSAHEIWLIYLVMGFYGIVNVAIGPAQSAVLVEMLRPEQLRAANAALRSGQEILRILAPLLGAGIFESVGGQAVALLDITTFLIAATLTWTLTVQENHGVRAGRHLRKDLAEGFVFVSSAPVLRRATVGCAFFMLAAGLGESVRWAVVSEGLHRGPSFIAVYQVALGLGAVAGGLASSRFMESVGEVRAMALGFSFFTCGIALQAAGALLPVLVGAGLTGAAAPLAVVAALTLLQRATPGNLQGRVYSSFELLTTLPQIASIGVGSALVGILDYRVLLAAMVVVGLCSVLLTEGFPRKGQA